MNQPLPLSVAVITLNEEASLQRCLDSVRGLAVEIVVLDSGSTDQTEAIARRLGARFASSPWEGFIAQKNKAMRLCTQPWVLNLDADEEVSPELAAALTRALSDPPPGVCGFELNRRTFYLGDWIWHAWYPEWILRVARREEGCWGGLDPHAKLEVNGPTRRLPGDLLHYSFRDLDDHLRRTLSYARTMARSYAARGRRFRWRYLLLSPVFAFLKHLLLKQGFRDGWRGWLISGIKAVDVFSKYAYLLEAERCPPPGSSEANAGKSQR